MHRRNVSRVALGLALSAAALLAAPALLASPGPRPAESKSQPASLVDVNTAGVEELMSVPGIGASLAQRIVEFREKNGPYGSVDDLLKVQGIGEKSLARFRDRLTAGKARK